MFKHLQTWDNLKSITLFVQSEYEALLHLWNQTRFGLRFRDPSCSKNLEILNSALGKKGYNSHLKRELHVLLGDERRERFWLSGSPLVYFNAEEDVPTNYSRTGQMFSEDV